jgi:hypothetical protein
MQDFPANSHKSKEPAEGPDKGSEPKKIEKIVTGPVTKQKRSVGIRFKEVFFGGEFKSATRYIGADVLLPALRNLVVDAVESGIKRMVYGEGNFTRGRSQANTPTEYRPRTVYNSPIDRSRSRAYLPDQPPHQLPSRGGNEDLVLVSREEAQAVLEQLGAIIERYDVVSVADLYETVGLPSTHVDNKWGWASLNNSVIRQVRNGFLLELPRPQEI